VATSTVDESRSDRAAGRRAAIAWGLPVMIGLALVVAGIVSFTASFVAGLATVLLFGGLLVAGGVLEIFAAYRHARERGAWLTGLAGLLSVLVGAFVMSRPLEGLAGTTLVLGTFFVANGLFRGVTSVVDRYAHWGWDLAYGLAAVALGVLVVSTWPISSLYFVGTLVGIELCARGGAWVGAGIAIRKVLRSGADAEALG
jgi:uncharacterized membrane protein HdeD (DUF308 family)